MKIKTSASAWVSTENHSRGLAPKINFFVFLIPREAWLAVIV